MIISFLLLFSIQFLSYELKPLIRNDELSQHKTEEAGYELYHKLDEAAQKALDLAEEAKSFAEEAGKLQVLQYDLRKQIEKQKIDCISKYPENEIDHIESIGKRRY